MASVPPSCCTCATLLSTPLSEKPVPPRTLPCCSRFICAACISRNRRFETYCPFCQVSTTPSALPPGGLREPPTYTEKRPPTPPGRRKRDSKIETMSESAVSSDEMPPAYSEIGPGNDNELQEEQQEEGEDVTHHLHPSDTLQSLSLAYKVPPQILRAHNSIYSDHLLAARNTVSIPASHYRGPSLSSEPVEGAEEAERKARIRRFMVGAKCHEYKVAELYLSEYKNADDAVERYKEDERWEKENPLQAKKGKTKGAGGGSLAGQLR